MANALIEAKDLRYGTPEGKILAEKLGFKVEPGDLLLVGGPNGSGKSTLLRVLLGHDRYLGGTLAIGPRPREIAVLPQLQNNEFHLPLTLRDVLEIALKRRVTAEEAVAVGLLDEHHLDLAWNTASGGERKRTLLTRLLMQSPKLLILDEPMNHLDNLSRKKVLGAVLRFLEGAPTRGVIMVSHERSLEGFQNQFRSLKRLSLGDPKAPLEPIESEAP